MLPPQEVIGKINVEVESLKAVADEMRASLEKAYRTSVPTVQDAMKPGASIGNGIAGAEWVRLQDKYHKCITQTLAAVFNIDKGTQAVAQAAEIISKQYGESDTLSRASANAVNSTLVVDPPAPVTDAPTGGGTRAGL
jgi:hypothetical protein